MGDVEAVALAIVESTLKYHPWTVGILTPTRYPGCGQCLVGSLTGAVASQKVTEAPKGSLSTVGNRALSVKAQESLTARQTSQADGKPGLSDLAVGHGTAVT